MEGTDPTSDTSPSYHDILLYPPVRGDLDPKPFPPPLNFHQVHPDDEFPPTPFITIQERSFMFSNTPEGDVFHYSTAFFRSQFQVQRRCFGSIRVQRRKTPEEMDHRYQGDTPWWPPACFFVLVISASPCVKCIGYREGGVHVALIKCLVYVSSF